MWAVQIITNLPAGSAARKLLYELLNDTTKIWSEKCRECFNFLCIKNGYIVLLLWQLSPKDMCHISFLTNSRSFKWRMFNISFYWLLKWPTDHVKRDCMVEWMCPIYLSCNPFFTLLFTVMMAFFLNSVTLFFLNDLPSFVISQIEKFHFIGWSLSLFLPSTFDFALCKVYSGLKFLGDKLALPWMDSLLRTIRLYISLNFILGYGDSVFLTVPYWYSIAYLYLNNIINWPTSFFLAMFLTRQSHYEVA